MARIKNASLYVDSKKVATLSNADLTLNGNDEAQFGDGQFLGYSDGVVESSISADAVIPVGDVQSAYVLDAFLGKKNVTVGWQGGGKRLQLENVRITGYKEATVTKSGTLTGSFTFGGGAPSVIG